MCVHCEDPELIIQSSPILRRLQTKFAVRTHASQRFDSVGCIVHHAILRVPCSFSVPGILLGDAWVESGPLRWRLHTRSRHTVPCIRRKCVGRGLHLPYEVDAGVRPLRRQPGAVHAEPDHVHLVQRTTRRGLNRGGNRSLYFQQSRSCHEHGRQEVRVRNPFFRVDVVKGNKCDTSTDNMVV